MTIVPNQAKKEPAPGVQSSQATTAAPGAATLVLGLGNPLLGDDGAGWKIVNQLRNQIPAQEVEFDCLDCSGLASWSVWSAIAEPFWWMP